MALFPWRLQGDIPQGELDPLVTVFLGAERYVMDENGEPTTERFIEQSTANFLTMKLSEVPGILTSRETLEKARVAAKAARPPLSPI
jgi:hypothetical protein